MNPSLERKKRKPVLKRAEGADLPRFRLTPRDLAILHAIHSYRALTAPQIAALFFPSAHGTAVEVNTRCKLRLRLLYHHGFLYRDEQPQKLSEGRKPLVYFLDRAGAAYLADHLDVTVDWDPRDNDVSFPFLKHLLATNDVRVAVSTSAIRHDWRIHTWLDDKMLKSPQMKDHVSLRGEKGQRSDASVVPDAYFRIETEEDAYNFFLEVDLGTVTGEATEWGKRDWARKVKAYLEYYRSGLYQKRYQTSDMRILTITTSEKRLAHLKTVTEKAGGKARFWFSTFARAKEDFLTSMIWDVAAHVERRALF